MFRTLNYLPDFVKFAQPAPDYRLTSG